MPEQCYLEYEGLENESGSRTCKGPTKNDILMLLMQQKSIYARD
jgi:hypothetical protein